MYQLHHCMLYFFFLILESQVLVLAFSKSISSKSTMEMTVHVSQGCDLGNAWGQCLVCTSWWWIRALRRDSHPLSSLHLCWSSYSHTLILRPCWLGSKRPHLPVPSWVGSFQVQFSRSVVSDSLQPHGLQHTRPTYSSPTPWELTQTHAHWVGDAIQPSHPLSFPSPPAFNLSQHQGLFQWVSSSHHVPNYWSFSFSLSPSNEYSALISFMMDLLDLLDVQGTLKSLFQHHSSKASILRCSAFFIVQLSYPYMTTGKTIALTRASFQVQRHFFGFMAFCLFVCLFLLLITSGEKSVMSGKLTFT